MRKRITFKGKVQGVGFRITTFTIAHKLGIRGWVRNNSDGSVTMVVEGLPEKINQLEEELETKFSGYISQKEELEETTNEKLTDFRILY
ncbi:acylphosphatase [bacterium]|nr:acylphosphatase [bacterium]